MKIKKDGEMVMMTGAEKNRREGENMTAKIFVAAICMLQKSVPEKPVPETDFSWCRGGKICL